MATVLTILAAPALPAEATFPASGNQGKIAFQSSRDGDNEIYTMYFDGTVVTKLTDNTAADADPRWSPDGQKIAFQSNRDGDTEIWAMNGDGSDPVQLTNNLAFDGFPAWSPDGSRIVFTSSRNGDNEILTMAADGTNQTPITANTANDRSPTWGSCCATGGKIAFVSDRDGNDEIYVMNDDGTGQTNLSGNAAADRDPNWRPWDTPRIAFASDRDGTFQIYRMEPDGTNQSRMVVSTADDTAPAWSPSGGSTLFAFERNAGESEIYVETFSGSGNLTNAATNERRPDWQATNDCCSGLQSPRPRGATPMRVALVPVYGQCAASNRTHGPPLAYPSCSPPVPASGYVTVGTPDAGGAPANFVGSMRLDVVVGDPNPPNDSDVELVTSLADLRCRPAASTCGATNSANGADYTGEVRASIVLRVTDRFSPDPSHITNATTSDTEFSFSFPCVGTASTATGSDCSLASSANAVLPGVVRENMRTIWQIGQVRIADGGADGDADTTGDNNPFAAQGVFVP